MSNRLNVFGVMNHLGHNYEQLKLAKKYPVKFHYLLNNVRRWSDRAHRPEPTTWLSEDEFEWVDSYTPGKYDVAILSVDQQHVNPDIGKGWLYRDLNEVINDIPKIVVNHGSPMYPEMYDEDTVINGGEVIDRKGKPRKIVGMKEKIGDNFMIVNSYESVKRWGWGYPLIHGLDPDEYWDKPKEPRVIMSLSPGGLDTYYNRQLITHIKVRLQERTGLDLFHTNVGQHRQIADWDDYRQLMGTSLIKITPFKDSPMPRARTEAMLSGCCILTSKYQDADKFIENGVNGFIIPDNPQSYVETIHQLLNYNYRDTLEIGQRAKETAKKYFSLERYHKQLYDILTRVATGEKPEWDKSTIYD